MARLSGTDRGQVALVGAFAIAVLLVVLAVVLSSAIQVEARAAHGHGPESVDVLRYQSEAVRTIDSLASRTDWDANNPTCEADVAASVDAWSELAASHAASEGALLTLSVDNVECSGGSVTAIEYTFTYTTPTLTYESAANGGP